MELPKEALPSLDVNSPLVTEVCKDLEHLCFPVVGEFHGAVFGIKDPTQDFFALGPTPISYQHLLFRHGLFLIEGVIVGWWEDAVNCMEDTAMDVLAKCWRSLADSNEVINEHINMGNGAQMD